jgi:Ser/Thr protein kinase RdoA (MazF antagonist)
MEDINAVALAFGITPSYVYKTRYFYTVRCGRTEYRIMPTTLDDERLNALYEVKAALFDAGLRVCDKPIRALDGGLAVEGNAERYIMTECIHGHNPEAANKAEVLACFGALGCMHRVLRELKCEHTDILSSYRKGMARLKAIKKQLGCAKRLNDTDVSFLRRYSTYYELAQNAVDTLEGLSFGVTSPVHGAIKADNILIGSNVTFTDWELLHNGHFMEDTAQLVARYIRKYAFTAEDYLTLEELLTAYTAQNPVNDSELAILYALLMYPKRYIAICTKHYGGAHRFAPVGVQKKMEICHNQLDFLPGYVK